MLKEAGKELDKENIITGAPLRSKMLRFFQLG